ncbi:mechanosensitive ion channel family protein [Mangrovibacterium marinum]|uniref:Small conductance mechanosensitive channel n=1 Tax=Mangrovibacterium marinum TaxID=1639118 RepID=A0A2T5BXE9_9BACT|nr:mechanosensitive ion channel domain-containing protein [Mangrovibacterium marinum]PTN04819.1 small conductance mechanosensitive channel [Mangrovibacterium marinum]
MEVLENYTDKIKELIMTYGLKVVAAIIALVVGLWIINLIVKAFARVMEKKEVDPSLRGFINSLTGILLKIMLVITVISMVGIQMTSFIAILGAAGLAVGMALSGTLQNFAGGVMILIFKPFKVGDFIEAQGYMGTVSEIQIFITVLKTPDNKTILIPNGGLSTGSLVNFSTEERRRVDFSFGIAYGDNYDDAKALLLKLIAQDERIFKTPEPFIVLGALADSSVNITVRVWAKSSDYWGVFFDMNEKVYKEFDKHGLHIPFPQLDVHLEK